MKTKMHKPIAFYFFYAFLFLLWSWGLADAIHTLRHQADNSLWKLIAAGCSVVFCPILMLIMALVAVACIAEGVF